MGNWVVNSFVVLSTKLYIRNLARAISVSFSIFSYSLNTDHSSECPVAFTFFHTVWQKTKDEIAYYRWRFEIFGCTNVQILKRKKYEPNTWRQTILHTHSTNGIWEWNGKKSRVKSFLLRLNERTNQRANNAMCTAKKHMSIFMEPLGVCQNIIYEINTEQREAKNDNTFGGEVWNKISFLRLISFTIRAYK